MNYVDIALAGQLCQLFGAPSCGPWSSSSSFKDPSAREADGRAELPTTNDVSSVSAFLWQRNEGRGFTVEQPWRSATRTDSPTARVFHHECIFKQRLDQCTLRAQDEAQQPLRKASGFLSNRRWCVPLKRCGGRNGRPRSPRSSQWDQSHGKGYGVPLQSHLLKTFGVFFDKMQDGLQRGPVWLRSLFWMHGVFYSCE